MPTSEIPPKAKRFQEIVLGMIVGLFLALCLAWAVYPKIYLHYHPGQPWPVIPQRWVEYSDSSPTLVYFFLACTTAALGLWQTRFSRRLGHRTIVAVEPRRQSPGEFVEGAIFYRCKGRRFRFADRAKRHDVGGRFHGSIQIGWW